MAATLSSEYCSAGKVEVADKKHHRQTSLLAPSILQEGCCIVQLPRDLADLFTQCAAHVLGPDSDAQGADAPQRLKSKDVYEIRPSETPTSAVTAKASLLTYLTHGVSVEMAIF
jgi:hypothetical protein